MERKKYTTHVEEENTGKVSEPFVGYAATGSGYENTLVNDDIDDFIDSIPLGKLGYYTDDPKVFENRIAEIEADVERAEKGDESGWLTAEEFDLELKKEFPWLQ